MNVHAMFALWSTPCINNEKETGTRNLKGFASSVVCAYWERYKERHFKSRVSCSQIERDGGKILFSKSKRMALMYVKTAVAKQSTSTEKPANKCCSATRETRTCRLIIKRAIAEDARRRADTSDQCCRSKNPFLASLWGRVVLVNKTKDISPNCTIHSRKWPSGCCKTWKCQMHPTFMHKKSQVWHNFRIALLHIQVK